MTLSWEGFSNADETINTNHEVFQLGKILYDAQQLITQLDCSKPIDLVRLREILLHICYLINAVGQLRAEYGFVLENKEKLKSEILRILEKK